MTDEPRTLLVTVPGATLRRALEQTPGGVPEGVELVEWDMAAPPCSYTGCDTVVSGGEAAWAAGVSSKPTTLIWPGTEILRRVSSSSTPSATSSLTATMASSVAAVRRRSSSR